MDLISKQTLSPWHLKKGECRKSEEFQGVGVMRGGSCEPVIKKRSRAGEAFHTDSTAVLSTQITRESTEGERVDYTVVSPFGLYNMDRNSM